MRYVGTDHIDAVDGAELEGLVLGVEDDVDHGADLHRHDVVRRVQQDSLLQVVLERAVGPVKVFKSYYRLVKEYWWLIIIVE
jgi:hypothetical protein